MQFGPRSQKSEVLIGDPRIVEHQCRYRGLAKQFGLRRHIVDPTLVIGAQVVRDHGPERNDQRRQRGEQNNAEEFRPQRSVRPGPHEGLPITFRATASKRELIFRLP